MKRIEYCVFCLDRDLVVDVPEEYADEAYEIMDEAYFDWCDDTAEAEGFCCEEYILFKLEEAGIPYQEVEIGQ